MPGEGNSHGENMLTLDPAALQPKNGLPAGRQSAPHEGSTSPHLVELIGVARRDPAIAFDLGSLTSADIDIIAMGRAAGRQGICPSLCPEVPGSREADLWHFGREAV